MDGQQPTVQAWRLSLVIPAYNEEAGIRQAIDEAEQSLQRLGCEYEILVVDDGSRDGTSAATEAVAAQQPRVRLLKHEANRGYGAALRTGFEAAQFDRVAFTDADCQFDLADLKTLTQLTEQQPVAVGYRIARQDPWLRRFYSWGYNTLVRFLFGTRVRDCDCALKVFRKDALANLMPSARGFFVNAEMLTRARQLGYGVAEAGVTHRPRLRGSSKVSLLDIPRTLATLLPFWWSEVVFPAKRKPEPESARGSVLPFLLLVCMAGLLFFTRLSAPLLEPDEARYAEIPRQMLAADSFVVPMLHGQPYYDKPPLLYWLVIGSYRLFGVHDWSARLVSCLAGFLTVVVTYFWAQRTLGTRAAFLSGLVLCLSARFIYLGRMLTMDSLLALWVVGASACAHVAVADGRLRRGWWIVSALLCGLGVLTKGPVALLLVAAPVWMYVQLDRRAARVGWWWLIYLDAALSVASPWFVAMTQYDPEFPRYFFWRHNVQRFVAPFDHAEPVWFFLPSLLLGMLPWTLLLIPLTRFLFRRSARTAARRPATLGFFLLASLWCLIFFSLSGSKRVGYILPAMPPLALALGCYLDILLPRTKWRHATSYLTSVARSALVTRSRLATQMMSVVLVLGSGLSAAAGILRLTPAMPALIFAFALAGGCWLVRRDGRPAATWFACIVATFALLFAGVHELLPAYNRKFSLRGQVRPHAEVADNVPVACYPRRWDSVSFYLQRDDVRVYTSDQRSMLIDDLRQQPETLLFVKTQHLGEFLRDLPASLEFVQDDRQGTVTAGWVRPRAQVPSFLYAGR